MQSNIKFKEFCLLTKPRLVFSVILTAITSYVLANSEPSIDDWYNILYLIIGVYCTATAAHIINQSFERKSDALMERTKMRPIPQKKLSLKTAYAFSIFFLILGILVLLCINLLTSMICFITVLLYVFFYTPMKKIHPINTWIGAIPGALPAVLGWTAIENQINFSALLFFGILFFWQICHFLALSWVYRDDYKKGQFKMLSLNDNNGLCTAIIIFIHGILLLINVYFIMSYVQFTLAYQISFMILTLLFFLPMMSFVFKRTVMMAKTIFIFSITYLPIFYSIIFINFYYNQ